MDRRTKKDKSGHFLTGDGIYSDWSVPEKFRGNDIDCLAAYEDTGMEPSEIERILERGTPLVGGTAEMMKEYLAIGPASEFRALKEAEQKRREGCERCKRKSCDTCFRFGWHPDICQKCENQSHYSAKPFCPHCGRDLKGDSHEA